MVVLGLRYKEQRKKKKKKKIREDWTESCKNVFINKC